MYIYFMDEYIMFISKEKNDLEYPSFEVSETMAKKLINKPHKIIKVPDIEVTEDNFSNFFEEIETVIKPSPIEKLQMENKQLKQEMDAMKQNMQQTIAELTMMIATPQ